MTILTVSNLSMDLGGITTDTTSTEERDPAYSPTGITMIGSSAAAFGWGGTVPVGDLWCHFRVHTDTSLNSGENAMMSGGAISRGFSEFASSALSIKRTFESPKILLSPTGNNNNNNMNSNSQHRKLSHVMPRSATTQDFLLVPNRKTSAHSALNWGVPKSETVSSKMRRQTSLIFPEEVNNNDRCEVR